MADTVKGSVVSVHVSFCSEFDFKKACYAFDWSLSCLRDLGSD